MGFWRQGEGARECGLGGGGLVVGAEGEAEFDVVGGAAGFEFDGALEVGDGGGRGGVGQASVDEADEEAFRGVEGGDFEVPAAEDVVGVGVVGVGGEGAFGEVANEAGAFDFGAGVGEKREFAVADGDGGEIRGVGGEGGGAFGEGEGFGEEVLFGVGVGEREVFGEVGELAGDFFEEGGIVGAGEEGAAVERKGGGGIEAGFGSGGVGEEGGEVGLGSGGASGGENEKEKGSKDEVEARWEHGRGSRERGSGVEWGG